MARSFKFQSHSKFEQNNVLRVLPNISNLEKTICKSYHIWKQIHVPFKAKENSSTRLLQLVHMDSCGPVRMQTPNGKLYFMLII